MHESHYVDCKVELHEWIIALWSNIKKQSKSWDCLMAGHTLKIRAVDTIIDTIKETTNIGSTWGKRNIKRSICITTLIV